MAHAGMPLCRPLKSAALHTHQLDRADENASRVETLKHAYLIRATAFFIRSFGIK